MCFSGVYFLFHIMFFQAVVSKLFYTGHFDPGSPFFFAKSLWDQRAWSCSLICRLALTHEALMMTLHLLHSLNYLKGSVLSGSSWVSSRLYMCDGHLQEFFMGESGQGKLWWAQGEGTATTVPHLPAAGRCSPAPPTGSSWVPALLPPLPATTGSASRPLLPLPLRCWLKLQQVTL